MYYMMLMEEDEDGNLMGVTYERDVPGRSWMDCCLWTIDADQAHARPPSEPISVHIKPGREEAPLADFIEMPIPLLSGRMYQVLTDNGVDNLQTFKVKLYYPDGSLASDNHVAFNVIGTVAVADLQSSTYDTAQPDSLIAMNFDSLQVDENKTHSLLMFRLAENVGAILFHEKLKIAVENAGFETVSFAAIGDVAIL